MKKNNYRTTCNILMLVLFVFYAALWGAPNTFAGNNDSIVAYVVCSDRQIYKIDMSTGKVIYKTDVIVEIGKPTAIYADWKRSLLYVASEMGHWQGNYSPIVVIDMKALPDKKIKQFDLIVDDSPNLFSKVKPVYDIVVSPDGGNLYIIYGHPKYEGGTTVVDSQTGEIKRHLDFFIDKGAIFSPDGKQVVTMWPGGEFVVEEAGKKVVRKLPGVVSTYDVEKSKKISKKELKGDNKGLYPEWGKIDKPYIKIQRGVGNAILLKKYEREKGKLISEIDIHALTGLYPIEEYPRVAGRNEIVIAMVDSDRHGYVVMVDIEKNEILSRIKVGDNPTNVVIN